MTVRTDQREATSQLRCGIVLTVEENVCQIVGQGQRSSAGFATVFPSPRTERVLPGHLVAVAITPSGSEVVVWRWYDAVVLGEETGGLRMWEPAHGEVVARPRHPQQPQLPGTRAYLSAGLPGADWWVAGSTAAEPEHADVELDEVKRLYTAR